MARGRKSSQLVPRKRTSRKQAFDPVKEIQVAMNTGKIIIGTNSVLKSIREQTIKYIVLANNTPEPIVEDINILNNVLEEKIPIYTINQSSWDLGATCGKPFMIASLGIVEPGDSAIHKLFE